MKIKFTEDAKDIREGASKSFRKDSEIVLSRELGSVYIKNGSAVEINNEGVIVKQKVKKKKIEQDGEV